MFKQRKLESYTDILGALGRRARALRIQRELRQSELAERAGLASGTVVRFERTGRASIENVLRIATVLGAAEAFAKLFEQPKYRTFEEAMQELTPERKRVRARRKR